MIKKIVTVIAVILIIAVSVVAYLFLKSPEEASGPIEAIPLPVNATPTVEQINFATETVASTTEAESEIKTDLKTDPMVDTGTPGSDAATAPDPVAEFEPDAETNTVTDAPTEEVVAKTEATTPDETTPVIFEIAPAESEARFYINEVLRGTPITVVGVTDQIAGQFALNPDNLTKTQVGVIQVNARTLTTDNQFRNRAIKNRILLTDDYEFITFSPTELSGLPTTGAIGETYTFQVAGELTITDVARPTTFEITATAISDSRIKATATTAFLYTDFALFIPDAPAVDTVDDEVRLEIEFVAEAVE
ncbi:MAG: YceI family protein [Anaerolineae bacterium]|nr:YceI family protein [Anaerolineae bacterium]